MEYIDTQDSMIGDQLKLNGRITVKILKLKKLPKAKAVNLIC